MFTYKSGSLVVLSVPLSFSLKNVVAKIYENSEPREVYLPFVLFGIIFILFMIFFLGNFLMGLVAAKKESQTAEFVEREKLWKSVFKLLLFLSVQAFLIGFAFTFMALEDRLFFYLFVYSIPSLGFLFSMYEFHSIGENWRRRFGSKPKIFNFFEKLTSVVENNIIKRLTNTIK